MKQCSRGLPELNPKEFSRVLSKLYECIVVCTDSADSAAFGRFLARYDPRTGIRSESTLHRGPQFLLREFSNLSLSIGFEFLRRASRRAVSENAADSAVREGSEGTLPRNRGSRDIHGDRSRLFAPLFDKILGIAPLISVVKRRAANESIHSNWDGFHGRLALPGPVPELRYIDGVVVCFRAKYRHSVRGIA